MSNLHLSGLHSTPDAVVRRETLALIEAHKPLVVSHTEAWRHVDALADIPGFALYGTGECALQLRDDIRASEREEVLSPLPIPRRNNARCKVLVARVAASALGPAHTRIVLHLPSGVEGLTGIRRNEQGRVWRDCIEGLQELVASIDGPVVITGDWNVNLRRRWVRRYLRRHFPGFVLRVPPRGTHGLRAIDFSLARGFTVTASTVLDNPASDHKALLERMKETAVAHPKTDALVAALRRRGVEVLTHEQWGSQHAALYVQRLRTHPHGLLPSQPVDTLWNHITVTNDDGPLLGDFKADMREVERIGFQRFGSGFSYNIGVDRNADRPRVALGQFLEAKGTHTVNDKGIAGFSHNQNKVALAVAWVGVPGDRLNPHAIAAMVQLRAALIEVGAMTTSYDDVPHSLVAAKDCPTDELRHRLPELKRLGLAAVKPRATVTPSRVTRVKADLLRVLNGSDARGIPTQRRFVRGLLATIRATVNRLPER